MMPGANAFLHAPTDRVTAQMEHEFFCSIMVRNRTWKTTFHGRFREVNERLISEVGAGRVRVASILDVGVSSGISTLELYNDISSRGYETHIVGTDLFTHAYLVRVGTSCHALVDDTGFPLQFDLFGRGITPWVTQRDQRNGMFVFRKLVNLAFTRRARAILRHTDDVRVERVRLVTPRLAGITNISLQTDDVTCYNSDFCARFGFIRAANILNRGYFAEPALVAIIDNIRHYLDGCGASLLVIRTHEDGNNHGTLFKLVNDRRFEISTRFGAGSEIEDLVLRATA